MKQLSLIAVLFLFFCVGVKAQVTIGSLVEPNPNALLDLKQFTDNTSDKGVLMPRMALTAKNDPAPLQNHVKGMIIYNTAEAGTGNQKVTEGFYYNTGSEWRKFAFLDEGNWFYLPSAVIDVSQDAVNKTLNLYDEYAKSFATGNVISNPAARKPVATNAYSAADLNYYVTSYDDQVFSNISIDNNGVMTYSVDASKVTSATHMNIILMVK